MRGIHRFHTRRDPARGMTLPEVMIAIVILGVLAWGTVALLVQGRTEVEKANHRRVATQLGLERIERAVTGSYSGLVDATGSVRLNGTNYSWILDTWTVQADPADVNSVYKQIELTVTWAGGGEDAVVLYSARNQ